MSRCRWDVCIPSISNLSAVSYQLLHRRPVIVCISSLRALNSNTMASRTSISTVLFCLCFVSQTLLQMYTINAITHFLMQHKTELEFKIVERVKVVRDEGGKGIQIASVLPYRGFTAAGFGTARGWVKKDVNV